VSDAVDRGIAVTELAPMGEAIEVLPETTAAVIGRALCGPLNEPLLVRDFGEFRRRFGDCWSRSSLGPAVRQFFDHGGRRLYVVRVANNARGAMLCLPASGSALVLRAVEPGSTEQVRAAVDYDGIDSADEEFFNLTLQRVDSKTGHIVDQEYYRRASYRGDSSTFIVDSLLNSSLARVEQPFPTHRPEPTPGSGSKPGSAYIGPCQEGTDGHELSDYDIIGSRARGTGLFALRQLDQLDLLYLPPPGKGRDLGPASLLAAELFCRERGTMLVVDPLRDWFTPAEAVAGMRKLGLTSANALSYFPRMYRRDEAGATPRAVGAALVGALCRQDRSSETWRREDAPEVALARDFVAACNVDDRDAVTLERAGINAIVSGPAGRARFRAAVTTGHNGAAQSQFKSLPIRRLCLRIVSSIDRATRWAVFEPDGARIDRRVRAQVSAYLAALSSMGAFEEGRYFVACDARSAERKEDWGRGFTILVSFQPRACSHVVSYTLHQGASGCRISSTAFAPVMESCA
jgi:hypothetical protein